MDFSEAISSQSKSELWLILNTNLCPNRPHLCILDFVLIYKKTFSCSPKKSPSGMGNEIPNSVLPLQPSCSKLVRIIWYLTSNVLDPCVIDTGRSNSHGLDFIGEPYEVAKFIRLKRRTVSILKMCKSQMVIPNTLPNWKSSHAKYWTHGLPSPSKHVKPKWWQTFFPLDPWINNNNNNNIQVFLSYIPLHYNSQ